MRSLSIHPKQAIIKKNCLKYKNDKSIINELKLIVKSRSIKDKSEEDLIKILSQPKPKTSLSKKKKEITKDFSELRQVF